MISGAQIRGARKLLNWPREKLARRARLTIEAIARAESVDDDPPITIANLYALERALEDGGVEFIDEDAGGEGVRLRKESLSG